MRQILVPAALILFSGMGVVRFGSLEGPRDDGASAAAVTRVQGLETELEVLASELRAVAQRLEADRQGDLRDAVLELEQGFGQAIERLASADERIGTLEAFESRWQEESIESELATLRARVEESSAELARLRSEDAARGASQASQVHELQQSVEARLAALNAERDTAILWRALLGPSVQILGDTTVGSGVLLKSRPLPGGDWQTYVLTAWHVVRDVYGGPNASHHPVPVKVYDRQGAHQDEQASLVIYDASLDCALLELGSREHFPHGVELPARERLSAAGVFDPIYAVGCPLGNDPIPTAGEIASTAHEIDGELYWMISAPTYIGNSGGGIFAADTHELLGIFSKIYTHGSMRSTIVPHMGLATPLERIYDWLEEHQYAHLLSAPADGLAGEPAAEPLSAAPVAAAVSER